MNKIFDLVVSALRSVGAIPHPEYEYALKCAFQKHPPVQQNDWFGRNYFTHARNKLWFANSLIENARMEGYGSAQIWKFSNRLIDKEYIKKVRSHSLDESRHSKLFITMLTLFFQKHWKMKS